MARVVVVDVRESLEILSERLCYGLQVFCFLDAINPEAFVLFCCEESNVAWSHTVMVEDDWFICHCLGGVRLVVRMLAFYLSPFAGRGIRLFHVCAIFWY